MNVQIKHEGTDITNYVIQYSREHKVCTGIGSLSMDVTYDLIGTFTTWDTIDVYENGTKVARYYISQITDNQPAATVTVDAQDNSKRLTDYFISDTYLVDYPSYTKYWLEKFIEEAGITVSFQASGDGAMLSNNTSLGLVTAYEQVMMLLQMSGWYITFNSSGVAVIGKLDVDWASVRDNINDTDILNIKLIKHDKMLRNRVLVWGTGDPTSGRWVFADVSRPTRWDYDRLDKRTIVIANSNIPNTSSAFLIANQALNEFARITTEKHIEIAGAGPATVGTAVKVKNLVWSGKGLVTTQRVDMSRNGLITTYVLDERCPRLFAFFNPGAHVYVGTFGAGVWRKHIQYFTSGWSNYSTGLGELNVTDLHVNNGVLACVTASGGAYYNIEDEGGWNQVTITGLSVISSSGTLIEPTTYSGLMTRACIIDRETDYARYAIDTRSGINLGDFLSETNAIGSGEFGGGSFSTLSGILLAGSGLRSWVLDVSPFNGSIENTYPVHISGNYEVCVFDIENDGVTDYLSAAAVTSGGAGLPYSGGNWDFGYRNNLTNNGIFGIANAYSTGDSRISTSFSNDVLFDNPSGYFTGTVISGVFSAYGLSLYNNTIVGDRDFVYQNAARTLSRRHIYWDDGGGSWTVQSTTSPTFPRAFSTILIKKTGQNIYDVYYFDSPSGLYKTTWNLDTGTISAETTIHTFTVNNPPNQSNMCGYTINNNIIYAGQAYRTDNTNGRSLAARYRIYLVTIDTNDDSVTQDLIFDTNDVAATVPGYLNHDFWIDFSRPFFTPYNDTFIMMFPYMHRYDNYDYINYPSVPQDFNQSYRVFRFIPPNAETDFEVTFAVINSTLPNSAQQYNTITPLQSIAVNDDTTLMSYALRSINGNYSSIAVAVTNTNWQKMDITWDGTINALPFYLRPAQVRPIYGLPDDRYLALNPTDNFYYEARTNMTQGEKQTNPTNLELKYPFNMRDSVTNEVYWAAFDTALGEGRIVSTIITNPGSVEKRFYYPYSGMIGQMGVNGGNFFFQNDGKYVYYDNAPADVTGVTYYVLRRDNFDYLVLWSGAYQQRLDISLYAPLVTMDRRLSSLQTFYIATEGYVQSTHTAMSGYNLGVDGAQGGVFEMGIVVDDFRYADMEYTAIMGSGSEQTAPRTLFTLYSGAVGTVDLYTLESFNGIYLSPSGYANRVETSNFCLPDQYVFLTMSGYTTSSGWGFYQKDPEGAFVDYTAGFPQSRPTIIRLDDKV